MSFKEVESGMKLAPQSKFGQLFCLPELRSESREQSACAKTFTSTNIQTVRSWLVHTEMRTRHCFSFVIYHQTSQEYTRGLGHICAHVDMHNMYSLHTYSCPSNP